MKNLIIIAAIGRNNELGLNNNLIWRLSGDLRFFRDNTINHSIVMGFNTFESLPGLLKNRNHIIITHRELNIPDVKIVHSIEEFFEYAKSLKDDIYVIGGASIYKALLPFCDKMLLTHIDAVHEADVFFPEFYQNDWDSEIIDEKEESGIKYKHLVYKRNDR